MLRNRLETPVLILAGGEGSRFTPTTQVVPKALIPVAGKPCIRWIIDELVSQGFNKLIVCVNEPHEDLFAHELRDTGVRFSVSKKPLGTCGEIINASKLIDSDIFMIVYADDLTHTNYRGLLELLSSGDMALAITNSVDLDFGLVISKGIHVQGFLEKPNLKHVTGNGIWTGRLAMRTSSLSDLQGCYDLAKDVFPKLLQQGKRLVILSSDELWFDVGSVAHWRKANEEYAR